MTACLILLLFNGLYVFFEHPFDSVGFVVSYIGVSFSPPFSTKYVPNDVEKIPVYIFLILTYKWKKHGFNVWKWGPERSKDLSGAIQASSEERKGRLVFPDSGLSKDNTRAFIRWAWAWIK